MAKFYKDQQFTFSKDGMACTYPGNRALKNRMNIKARTLGLGNIFTHNKYTDFISISTYNYTKWQVAINDRKSNLYVPIPLSNIQLFIPTELATSQLQWQEAETYFRDNPEKQKFTKPKSSQTKNSFIKIDEVIYLVENKRIPGQSLLGEGSFGKVKRVRSKAGKEFALKIVGIRDQTDQNNYQNSITINNTLKFLIGTVKRNFLPTKFFKGKQIVRKGYLLLKLHLGIGLQDQVKIQPPYHEQNKNIICLNIAEKIKFLHDRNIIHGDIKPSNIMIDGLEVKLFDFGLSTILQRNQLSVSKRSGSLFYIAPEVQEEHFMSKASDIYSFAIMLQRFFPKTLDNIINHVDCHNILSTEHSERPSIHQIIEALTLPQNKEEHTRFLTFFQALKNTNLENDVLAAPIIINPGTIAVPARHIRLELAADQNKNSALNSIWPA